MFTFVKHQKEKFLFSTASRLIVFALSLSLIYSPTASYAQSVLNLPTPGTMLSPSPAFVPVLLKGMTIHPDNPLRFDFIIDGGNTNFTQDEIKKESERLVKYFLASMTVPKDDLWVNLSPYENDRIIPEELGKTELGRDMLAQDYILKQLTASLMYPEEELGKKFWDKVYAKAEEQFGTREIPVNTFNKVWILPESATVYEHEQTVYVVNAHLKVMLDSDYQAMQYERPNVQDSNLELQSSIIKEIIIPEIEKEVNEGQHFAPLRQIYHSLILAKWYKETVKNSLLSQVYVDQNKIAGVESGDETVKDKIYTQYIEAYKKGVFNYIKEDYDQLSNEVIPRKYFSGGLKLDSGIDIEKSSSPIEDSKTPKYQMRVEIAPQKKGADNILARFKGLLNKLRPRKKQDRDYIRALANRPIINIPFYLPDGERTEVNTRGMVIMPEGKPLYEKSLRNVLYSAGKLGIDVKKLVKDWEMYKVAITIGGRNVLSERELDTYVHDKEEVRVILMPTPVKTIKIEGLNKKQYIMRAYRWEGSSEGKKSFHVAIWDNDLSKPIGKYNFDISGTHLKAATEFYKNSFQGFSIEGANQEEVQNKYLGFRMMKEGMKLAEEEGAQSFDWYDIIKFALDLSQQEEASHELNNIPDNEAKMRNLLRNVDKAKQLLERIEAQILSDGQLSESKGWTSDYANYQLKLWYASVLSVIQNSFHPLGDKAQDALVKKIFKKTKFNTGKQSHADFSTGYEWDSKMDLLAAMAHELGHNIINLSIISREEEKNNSLELEGKLEEGVRDIGSKSEYLSDILSYVFLEQMGFGHTIRRKMERIFLEGGLLTLGTSHQNARITLIHLVDSVDSIQWSLLAKRGLALYHSDPDLSFDEFHKRLFKDISGTMLDTPNPVQSSSPVSSDEEVGGIDLNKINVNRQGIGIDIQFDPVEMQEIIDLDIDGFAPIIINLTPLPSILPMLGLEPQREEDEIELTST